MTIRFDFATAKRLVKGYCLTEDIDMDEFARRVNERTGRRDGGLSGATVSAWLRGARSLHLDDASAIADELGRSLSEVFRTSPAALQGRLYTGESETKTIALKMKEAAGNEVQGATTEFEVTLLAFAVSEEGNEPSADESVGGTVEWENGGAVVEEPEYEYHFY